MLRKKNITLNGKKADGSEKLAIGDEIKIFFADDTLEKFSGASEQAAKPVIPVNDSFRLDVVFENDDIIIMNKPSGILSQKATPEDISLIEYMTA